MSWTYEFSGADAVKFCDSKTDGWFEYKDPNLADLSDANKIEYVRKTWPEMIAVVSNANFQVLKSE